MIIINFLKKNKIEFCADHSRLKLLHDRQHTTFKESVRPFNHTKK